MPKLLSLLSHKAVSRLEKMRRKARRVIFIERFWHHFRWSVFCLLFWMIGAFFHLPQYFSDLLRSLFEAAIFIYLIVSIPYCLKKILPITIEDVDRRLEEDSGLPFHPLTTLNDTPALLHNHKETNILHHYLWKKHCENAAKNLKDLRISPPHLFPTRKAKIGLFLFTLLSVGTLLHNQTTIETRFITAFLPWADDDQTPLPHLQAWIDKPSYAPGRPVFLQLSAPSPTEMLPEGSIVHLLLTDITSKPSLRGVRHYKIEQLSAQSWQITATLTHNTPLKLRVRGRNISHWELKILKDSAPKITWNGKIHHDNNLETIIPWKSEQIFGLKKISLILTSPYKNLEGKKESFELPLFFKSFETKLSENTPLDLSSHPLAGLKIDAQLKAESLSGKISYSEKKQFRIPPHPFHHALSRALIKLRQRSALSLSSYKDNKDALRLLTQIPQTTSTRLALTYILSNFTDKTAKEAQLWYLALYDEDLETYNSDIANIMAEIRSIAEDISLLLSDDPKENLLNHEMALHQKLDTLKIALHHRLNLTFQQAQNRALVLPDINGSATPWESISKKIEEEGRLHHKNQAKKYLRDMVNMAEQMRSVTQNDLEQLSHQMQQQNEMMSQKAALRHLIKEETTLLNHSQLRFYNETEKNDALDPHNSEDISQISTAELLEKLGMAVPPSLALQTTPHIKTDKDADPAIVLSQGDARQNDFYLQNALKTLDNILYQRAKNQLNYENKPLLQAKNDMEVALKALGTQKDYEANLAEQKVLKDLADALKEMQKKQKNNQDAKSQKLNLMMPPNGTSHSHSQKGHDPSQDGDPSNNDDNSQTQNQAPDPDQDLDKDSDYQDEMSGNNSDKKDAHKGKEHDPLGRPTATEHNDAHIPEKDNNNLRRKIEEELKRRASDQTRSQKELNYLNKLLSPFEEDSSEKGQ